MKFRNFSKMLNFALMVCLMSSDAFAANRKVKAQPVKAPVEEMVDRRICEAFPSDCICKDTLKNLWSLKKRLNDCCNTLDQRFTELEIAVQKINPCGTPTPIDQAFIDSALTNPIKASGQYCLVEDVTGLLTIDADNVVINMNNHSMTGNYSTGCIASTGHTNIQVLGYGYLRQGSPQAVMIQTCTYVKFDGVNFEENETGCTFDGVNSFLINSCSFVANDSQNFPANTTALGLFSSNIGKVTCCNMRNNNGFKDTCRIETSSSILFRQNSFNNNTTAPNVVTIFESNSCVFDSCIANDNAPGNGGRAFSFEGGSDCLCTDCVSNANSGATGFRMARSTNLVDSTKVICDNCRSSNNTSGFSIFGSNLCCILNCLANENELGITVSAAASNYVFHNKALANTSFGYTFTLGGLGNVWLSNYAQGNGTNYQTPAIPGPFSVFTISTGTFAPTETAWDNIDAQP